MQGLEAWSSMTDLPTPVDTAILTIPAAACSQAILEGRERGLATAVILAAGFSEGGTSEGQRI